MKFRAQRPWGKGAPTLQAVVPQNDSYEFEAEHARCLRLLDEFARRPSNESGRRTLSSDAMCGAT